MRPRTDVVITAHGDHYLVADPYGARPTITLSALQLELYWGLARGRSAAALQRAARVRGPISRDAIELFRAELGERGFLEDAMALADRRAALSRAIVHDTLVISDAAPVELCTALLDDARVAIARELGPDARRARLEGCLSPHGALEVTGAVAAHAYALLTAERWPDVFVIIGTSHYDRRPAVLTHDVQTSLGLVRGHRELAHRLLARVAPRFDRDTPAFVADHSWRRDLPLLQIAARAVGRELRVLPILIGDLDHAEARALARTLRELAFARLELPCVIASGDLTHYGAGYRWAPRWLGGRRSVAAVVEAVQAHERPILDAIAARDHARFARAVATTSFCARAQVSALMELATTQGRLFDHRSVVNWRPHQNGARTRRRWNGTDVLFDAASVVFARGLPTGDAPAALRMCSNLALNTEGDELVAVHRCDLVSRAVPAVAAPLVDVLWSGAPSTAAAAAATGFPAPAVDEFVAVLARSGFLHDPEPASELAPRWLHERAPPDLASRPFLFADDLRGVAVTPPTRRGYTMRRSSSSSGGAAVHTVVEKTVREDRRLAEALVCSPAGTLRCAHVNRNANLGLRPSRTGWPGVRLRGPDLLLTPGPNPSRVEPATWHALIERLVRFDPEELEGDPGFLAALARECQARGVAFPHLSAVYAGHGYTWQLYRSAIRAAFGLDPIVRYHSSELGEIGLGCTLGRLHLLDLNVLYEVTAGGREASLGELGELVATTLDTRFRPLVRYANGDVVRVVAPACACGKPFRIIEYAGRVTDLLVGPRGQPITYPALDAAVGAPAGVRFFQLAVTARGATLRIAPRDASGLFDAPALRDRVAALIRKPVRVAFVDGIDVVEPGKLHAVRVPDESARWHRRFLGVAPRAQPRLRGRGKP